MNKLHFESVDLSKSFRPLFTATVNHKKTNCIMDTGAVIAVFNKGLTYSTYGLVVFLMLL